MGVSWARMLSVEVSVAGAELAGQEKVKSEGAKGVGGRSCRT